MAMHTATGSETNQGRVWVGATEGEVFVRVEGRGTHVVSQPLSACLTEMASRGARAFFFDLAGCTHLDSTFLGVLTAFCVRWKASDARCVVTGSSARHLQLFRTLGIDRFFQFETADADAQPQQMQPLDPHASKEAYSATVLEAHRALMACDERNVPRFKDVVQFLEEELRKPGPTR